MALGAIVSVQGAAQTKLIDEVVASVGDDAILSSDIEYQYGQAMIEGANFNGDIKCHIFEQLLIQKLMLNQAKIDSVEVKDSEVMQQVDARMNSRWAVRTSWRSISISRCSKYAATRWRPSGRR